MKINNYIVYIVLLLIIIACNSGIKKLEQTRKDNWSYPSYRYENATPQHDVQETSQQQYPSLNAIPNTDSYEEGYLDGEAAAEEDRLAGIKGMQSGDDEDEDEDYEEGFDDGYEDY